MEGYVSIESGVRSVTLSKSKTTLRVTNIKILVLFNECRNINDTVSMLRKENIEESRPQLLTEELKKRTTRYIDSDNGLDYYLDI